MKANLEQAEVEYNTLRNSRGTVDLGEEEERVAAIRADAIEAG